MASVRLANNIKKMKMKDLETNDKVNDQVDEKLAENEISAENKPGNEKTIKDPSLQNIITVFRISASKNVKISEMADRKANIMISVNSIIISVVLGLMARTLVENQNLVIPTIVLLIVNVSTIIFSVLATRPKIADGRFTKEDIINKSVNLLYFGSYYKMSFKEFDEGLKTMISDREFFYANLSKDSFWQGKVLGRKYRLLRISYTIFLFGIIAAVLAFSAAIIFS